MYVRNTPITTPETFNKKRTQEQRVELLRKANILDADGHYMEQFFSAETIKKDRARKEK
jgi:hypothetical protein